MISPVKYKGVRDDELGDGYWGSNRGSRFHKGIDFICDPGENVLFPIVFGKIEDFSYEKILDFLLGGHYPCDFVRGIGDFYFLC